MVNVSPLAPDTGPGAAAVTLSSALLERALAVEADVGSWRRSFAAMLAHPAIAPLHWPQGTAVSLDAAAFAGQHATRFPLVSGDAEWLRQRSMAVVARRLAPLLAVGSSVALDLTELARGEACADTRREQMDDAAAGLATALPAALRPYGVSAAGLVLAVRADHPGLGALLRLRAGGALGRPRMILRLPDVLLRALQAGPAPAEALARWRGLTTLAQREAGIHLALPQTTRPACALASGERADTVLPGSLFEVRADTAWLALELRLDALRARDMAGALAELRGLLRAVLRFADNLVDRLDWCSAELAQDALVNRRLALHVTGIGTLADRWGLDPRDFRSVALLQRWLLVVRRLLVRESNALARERGPFPGLELRELARSLARSLGEERARRALRRAGLRHRHLLVLSPYDILPRTAARWPLPSYLELLPAIRAADTIATHGDGVVRALPPELFRRLLHQAWVIAHNRP